MSEMDLHGDVEDESSLDTATAELDRLEAPTPDDLEQALPVSEQNLDHEVVPQDEDEYR